MNRSGFYSTDELQQSLDRFPRVQLANLPTPLEKCRRLSKYLSKNTNEPIIYIKRDDLTESSMSSGNKLRHMEFRLGDDFAKNCDTYLYADYSNSGRAAAIGCAKAGMSYIQVVSSERLPNVRSNLLLSSILGAKLRYVNPGTNPREETYEETNRIEQGLIETGHKSYRIQAMPWYHQSAVISYLQAAIELDSQLKDLRIMNPHIFLVTGHSHVGLQLASKLLGLRWEITSIAVGQSFESPALPFENWSKQVSNLIGLPAELNLAEMTVNFDYVEPGYHHPSNKSLNAVKVMGNVEGVFLDPMYTGKAMATLIDYVISDSVKPNQSLVFLHTGGHPMLFDVESIGP